MRFIFLSFSFWSESANEWTTFCTFSIEWFVANNCPNNSSYPLSFNFIFLRNFFNFPIVWRKTLQMKWKRIFLVPICVFSSLYLFFFFLVFVRSFHFSYFEKLLKNLPTYRHEMKWSFQFCFCFYLIRFWFWFFVENRHSYRTNYIAKMVYLIHLFYFHFSSKTKTQEQKEKKILLD